MSTTEGFFCGTGIWGRGAMPGDPNNDALLAANSVFGGIDVQWTYPTINPFAVAHTQVFRGNSNVFADAVQIALADGNHYFDRINEDGTFYYWIRFVSVNGTEGEPIGPASAYATSLAHSIGQSLTGVLDFGMLGETLKTQISKIQLLDQAITQETTNRLTGDGEITTMMTQLQAGVDDAYAAVQTEIEARTSAQGMLAQQITTVQTGLGDQIVSAQESLTSRIDTVDGEIQSLGAQWVVKLNTNGKVAGVGLAIEDPVASPSTSAFLVQADKFGFATGAGDIMPFGADSSGLYVNGTLRVNSTGNTLADIAATSKRILLIASSQVFQIPKSGTGSSPGSITLQAYAYNLSGTPTWTVTAGGATLTAGMDSLQKILTFANMTTDSVTVQVTMDGVTDEMTVVKLREGTDAVTGLLTNEAMVVAADSVGNVSSFANAGGVFKVYNGTTDKTGTSDVTYSVVSTSNVTISIASTGIYTITAMSADTAIATLRAVYSGVTLDKVYTISKSKTGAQGIQGIQGNQGPQGPQGLTGATGSNGARGSVNIAVSGYSFWSDSAANSAIISGTGTNPVFGDVVTLYSSGFSQTKYYSGGSWLTLSAYINGNMLVSGTLSVGTLDIQGNAVTVPTYVDINTGTLVNGADITDNGPFSNTEGTLIAAITMPSSAVSQTNLIVAGFRTAVQGQDATTCARRAAIFKDGVMVYDYGWSPYIAEAITLTFKDTQSAGTSPQYTVRVKSRYVSTGATGSKGGMWITGVKR